VGSRTGIDGVERIKSCAYRDSNSDPSAVQPVAMPNALSRLVSFCTLNKIYDIRISSEQTPLLFLCCILHERSLSLSLFAEENL
jgi:hypothetical protein